MTTIHRAQHDKEHPFVMIARGVAQCKAISYEAVGLLTYLLSKPDDWEIIPDDLIRKGCKRDRVYKLLNELKEAGHIEHKRMDAEQGVPPMWGKRTIHEAPYTEMPDMVSTEAPDTPLPDTATPDMANAGYGETALTKTELTDQIQELNKERDARAHTRDTTPTPFHVQNGLGRTKPSQNPLVLKAKAHPVFQAYVRGRGGIAPEVPPPNAQDMIDVLDAIQSDIEAKLYGLQDVEDLVHFKLSIPHSKAYLLSYIKLDIADFVNGRQATANGKPRGSPEKPPPTNPPLRRTGVYVGEKP